RIASLPGAQQARHVRVPGHETVTAIEHVGGEGRSRQFRRGFLARPGVVVGVRQRRGERVAVEIEDATTLAVARAERVEDALDRLPAWARHLTRLDPLQVAGPEVRFGFDPELCL